MSVIDFHSHVLPGIDDGSKDVAMSREMLAKIKASGVDTVVATPHFYGNRRSLSEFLERRQGAIERLFAEVPPTEMPELRFGAEVAFYSGLTKENDLHKLCIDGTHTLLLEMPFSVWTDFEIGEVTKLCLDHGFKVAIAHIERYESFASDEMMRQLLRLPVYIQINSGTLLPWRGRKKWLNMFKEGQAQLLGSDCHNLTSRPPNLAEGREMIRRKLGDGALRKIDRTTAELLERDL